MDQVLEADVAESPRRLRARSTPTKQTRSYVDSSPSKSKRQHENASLSTPKEEQRSKKQKTSESKPPRSKGYGQLSVDPIKNARVYDGASSDSSSFTKYERLIKSSQFQSPLSVFGDSDQSSTPISGSQETSTDTTRSKTSIQAAGDLIESSQDSKEPTNSHRKLDISDILKELSQDSNGEDDSDEFLLEREQAKQTSRKLLEDEQELDTFEKWTKEFESRDCGKGELKWARVWKKDGIASSYTPVFAIRYGNESEISIEVILHEKESEIACLIINNTSSADLKDLSAPPRTCKINKHLQDRMLEYSEARNKLISTIEGELRKILDQEDQVLQRIGSGELQSELAKQYYKNPREVSIQCASFGQLEREGSIIRGLLLDYFQDKNLDPKFVSTVLTLEALRRVTSRIRKIPYHEVLGLMRS